MFDADFIHKGVKDMINYIININKFSQKEKIFFSLCLSLCLTFKLKIYKINMFCKFIQRG